MLRVNPSHFLITQQRNLLVCKPPHSPKGYLTNGGLGSTFPCCCRDPFWFQRNAVGALMMQHIGGKWGKDRGSRRLVKCLINTSQVFKCMEIPRCYTKICQISPLVRLGIARGKLTKNYRTVAMKNQILAIPPRSFRYRAGETNQILSHGRNEQSDFSVNSRLWSVFVRTAVVPPVLRNVPLAIRCNLY